MLRLPLASDRTTDSFPRGLLARFAVDTNNIIQSTLSLDAKIYDVFVVVNLFCDMLIITYTLLIIETLC